MQRSSFRDMNCSIGQSLEVVGEWWSLLIIRDAFFGVTRFDDFQERLGIARNVLNQRLAHLVEEGVLERVRYREHPPRFDYVLTEQGRDLWPVIVALRQWGDRWRAPDGPTRPAGASGMRPRGRAHPDLLRVRRADWPRGCDGHARTGRHRRRSPRVFSLMERTTDGPPTKRRSPAHADR